MEIVGCSSSSLMELAKEARDLMKPDPFPGFPAQLMHSPFTSAVTTPTTPDLFIISLTQVSTAASMFVSS
eukprot:CAMPEP_0174250130 /NCGR_PEP_ID=MMETSP0439-20130205/400_1 /TAXON_ID=0 /ORGANISM="Stereomyxa ramosa, Strain Chinc5" /LENGTH=69 /DNA_ID=CAMNT_0015330121 /DNA_START=110 /DNA_END=315 /DNA_ORIENTATION=-